MMKHLMITLCLTTAVFTAFSQEQADNKRLDFAKTYFELGGTFLPSFTGKSLNGNGISSFKNPASAMSYLTWGGFHFWGHAEFFVVIPLSYKPFEKRGDTGSELIHSVATGARFFPWVYQPGKIRPYAGVGWSTLDFRQRLLPDDNQPVLSKDFNLTFDTGFLYGYKDFALRVGVNYFKDHTWQYPLDKTFKTSIKTPALGLQLGLLYTMDLSKKNDQATIDRWNSYPRTSKQSLGSTKFGDFFIGVGPSLSFSLARSDYNRSHLPFLKDRLTSKNYFELSAGYHFYKAGLFATMAFRNPTFETKGFGTTQTIKKTSLNVEFSKFLTDYSGFTPFVGLNVAYDRLNFTESHESGKREMIFRNTAEPGLTLGWDIQPGKNEEALILRTNLRWYPFSSFAVDGKKFDFSQLEYNLIQAVLYPGRIKKKRGG